MSLRTPDQLRESLVHLHTLVRDANDQCSFNQTNDLHGLTSDIAQLRNKLDNAFAEHQRRGRQRPGDTREALVVRKLRRDYVRLRTNVQATLHRVDGVSQQAARPRTGGAQRGAPRVASTMQNRDRGSNAQPPHPTVTGTGTPNKQAHGTAIELTQTHAPPADHELQQQERDALLAIRRQTLGVQHLAQDVASLVDDSQTNVDSVETALEQSKAHMVDGLERLSDLKHKEAYKHTKRGTSLAAVVGGVAGIPAGPYGMAIGAGVGAVVGRVVGGGFTELSRRSIRRQLDQFKVNHAPQSTSDHEYVQVYENQRWSLFTRSWGRQYLQDGDFDVWTNQVGEPMPLNPESGHFLPPATDRSLSTQDDGLDGNVWEWAGNWKVDFSGSHTDLSGWQYSYAFATTPDSSGKMYQFTARPNTYSFVRRRKWVRKRRVSPLRDVATPEPARPQPAMHNVGHSDDVVKASLQSMLEAQTVTQDTAEQIAIQGKQIEDSAANAGMIHELNSHTKRVERASELLGALQNMFSTSTSKPDAAPQFFEDKLSRNVETCDTATTTEPLDQLRAVVENQKELSASIESHVEHHNDVLGYVDRHLGSGGLKRVLSKLRG